MLGDCGLCFPRGYASGAFAEFRKFSSHPSVQLSVRRKQLGYGRTDFRAFYIGNVCYDVSRNFRIGYNHLKIYGTFCEDLETFMISR
jgi:hypothetical protein